MITLTEIREILNEVWNLMVGINIDAENATRLTVSKYKGEDHIKNNGFFKYYLYQQKFVLAIKLCILLEDKQNQKLNFIKLIRRIETEKYDQELVKWLKNNKNLNKTGREGVLEETRKLKELIDNNQTLIDSISLVRNKNYSHLDRNRNNLGPTISKYKIAVDLISDIYNKLSLIFKGSTTMFKRLSSWEIDPIIKVLTENYNRRLENLDGE